MIIVIVKESLRNRPQDARLGVWIDQDLDTGSGIQVEICPEVFIMGQDGLTYTHIGKVIFGEGFRGIVPIPEDSEDRAIEAVQEDPGEITYLEYVKTDEDGFVSEVWDPRTHEWSAFEASREPIERLMPQAVEED